MKRIIPILLALTILLAGCGNRNMLIGNQVYNHALVDFGGEVKEYEIETWKDFEGGDQLEITTTDGTTLLIHSNRVILSYKKEKWVEED